MPCSIPISITCSIASRAAKRDWIDIVVVPSASAIVTVAIVVGSSALGGAKVSLTLPRTPMSG